MTYKGWEHYQVPGVPTPTRKRPKYGNVPQWVLTDHQIVTVDASVKPPGSIWFGSKREAARFVVLSQEQLAGTITGLQLQPQFPLEVTTAGGVRIIIGRYVADFSYWRVGSAIQVIEDVKGMKTDLYSWKKKHVEAEYGIHVTEV